MRRTRRPPQPPPNQQRSDKLSIDPYAIEDTAFTWSEIQRARGDA